MTFSVNIYYLFIICAILTSTLLGHVCHNNDLFMPCWFWTLDIYQYSAIGDAKSVLELLIALSLEGPC